MTADLHLYERLLGASWARLPDVTRALHAPDGAVLFEGEADIDRGRSFMARLCTAALRLPAAGRSVSARVKTTREDDGELLERWFAGRRFATLQGADEGRLVERFGPFRLSFRIEGGEAGIVFHQTGVTVWGIPIPRALAPRVEACEQADAETHIFDVRLSMPGIGEIVRYRGRLRQVDA